MSANSEFKYNPLTSGGFTELKDKIIFMFDQMNRPLDIIAAENEYLQLVFKVLEKWQQINCTKKIDLNSLALNIKEERLNKLALTIGDKELIDHVIEVTQRLNSRVGCLISEINSLIFSQIGHLFKCNENDKVINLEEDIKNKSIIYFSLSDLNFSVYASQLGKLIINDLKVIFGNTSENNPLNTFIVFDEFTTYAGSEFNSLIARARSKGLHAIICSQGFNAIKQSNAELAAHLSTNCNTFIIHQQNSEMDADMFSAIIGKHFKYVKLEKTSEVEVNLNNQASLHRVSSEEILSLKTGYAYILRKNDGSKIDLVKVELNSSF